MSRNKKILTGVVIGVLIVAFAVIAIIKNSGSTSAFGGGGYPVKAASVSKGDISSSISSSGVLEEIDKAEIYTDTPLKVDKVLVTVGQKVTKGEKLLEFDLDDMNSQLDSLKLNKSTQQVSASSKTLDLQVETALNNLKAAQKAYDDAKKTFGDNKALYESSAISKSELDMSEKAFIQADSGPAGLKNAKLSYESALEGAKTSRQTAADSIKGIDMQISDLEKRIEKTNADMLSPMDGIVAELNVSEGSYTNNMQSVLKVINPDKLQIKAKVKEFDIKNVAVGQTARITGDAIDKNTVINGKVTAISPVATVNRTTSGEETVVEVTVAVDGNKGALKPGLNVTCDIYTVDKKGALIVPMEALIPDKDDNTLVFVVDPKTNTLSEKKVTTGINSDMSVEVLEGLKEGDLVVLNPQPSYRDGLKVSIQQNGEK